MGIFNEGIFAIRPKDVWKGTKKLFAKLGKFLGSDLGKIIMIAISIFTMGAALIAAGGAFSTALSASGNFLTAFVEGGKAFMNALGANFTMKFGEAGAGLAEGVTGAVEAGSALEGAATIPGGPAVPAEAVLEGANATAGAGGITGGAEVGGVALGEGGVASTAAAAPGFEAANQIVSQGASNAAKFGSTLGKTAAKQPGWLSKAANAALEFAKGPAGQEIIGQGAQGYFQGEQLQAILDERRRVSDQFANPNDPGMIALREHDFSVDTPRGLAGASGRFARRENESTGRFTPTIPFKRSPVPVGG